MSIPHAHHFVADPSGSFGTCRCGASLRHGQVLEPPKAPTVEQYADELVRLIALDAYESPRDYEHVRSWEALHAICDANEYLIVADQNLGIDTMELGDDFAFVSEAQELAAAKLGWTAREHDGGPSQAQFEDALEEAAERRRAEIDAGEPRSYIYRGIE